MKALVPTSFIAALVAFVLLPVSFYVAGSALFAAGFVAIVFSDYSRRAGFTPPRAVAAVTLPSRERFGLAA